MQPGGLVGTVIARTLASGLNTVGATVILVATAATGLLLATNFSFVGLYEKLVAAIGDRFAFLRTAPARFRAWRQTRREEARLRKEKKLALQAEQEAARNALKAGRDLSPADRVAEFMKQPNGSSVASTAAVIRGETDMAPQGSIAATERTRKSCRRGCRNAGRHGCGESVR